MPFPPNAGPARDQAMLERLAAGAFDVRWAAVESAAGGHTGIFHVFADALKIDGVRVIVSASLEQTIADRLACLLVTPKLADLLWAQRAVTLRPRPQPATAQMGSTAAMLDQSEWIDGQLASLGVPLEGTSAIVQTVGKHWVLTNALLAHPGRAVNYGWHFDGSFPGADGKPSAWSACASMKSATCRVIQGPGWAHDAQHTDYSQSCVLVSRTCEVDGRAMDLAAVLQDPELAPLASHEGVLRVLRQPGVTPSGPIPEPPGEAAPSTFTPVSVRSRAGGPSAGAVVGGFALAAGAGLLTWEALRRRRA